MPRSTQVLLGVTGGIAAFKAPALVRELRRRGCAVRCALTQSAAAFVAPLSLEVLTGSRVYGEEYLAANGSGEELHLTAAEWADVYCIAPATAHTLTRLSLGLADDFVTTTALMHRGPMVVAPAMHWAMWEKVTMSEHMERLAQRGVHVVGPDDGPLASGESGIGRMAELAAIADAVERVAPPASAVTESEDEPLPLDGRRVVVSAGPTEEPIDPVRFLTNRSSGRMGFAIAEHAVRLGAQTTLVAGPVALDTPSGVDRIDVRTAAEMKRALDAVCPPADIVVMTAAVADFRPAEVRAEKLKKRGGVPEIALEPTTDILAGLRDVAPQAILVGFAAETDDVEGEARRKLERKRLDLIVANDVSRPDIGFRSAENEVTIFGRHVDPVVVSRRPKPEVASSLWREILRRMENRESRAVTVDR